MNVNWTRVHKTDSGDITLIGLTLFWGPVLLCGVRRDGTGRDGCFSSTLIYPGVTPCYTHRTFNQPPPTAPVWHTYIEHCNLPLSNKEWNPSLIKIGETAKQSLFAWETLNRSVMFWVLDASLKGLLRLFLAFLLSSAAGVTLRG